MTSGDSVQLLGGAWQNPRLGVVSLFIPGAGVDVLVSTVVVLSQVSPTAQTESHSCVCQTGNYHQGCCPVLCNFGQHSSNDTKFSIVGRVLLAKLVQERRFNQHREKAFTWYASGSGFFYAYLKHFVFRQLANRSISGFPNWSKRDLAINQSKAFIFG